MKTEAQILALIKLTKERLSVETDAMRQLYFAGQIVTLEWVLNTTNDTEEV